MFKVGDLVKIKKGTRYYYQAPNKVGKITQIRSKNWYSVDFGDYNNGYEIGDLEFYKPIWKRIIEEGD